MRIVKNKNQILVSSLTRAKLMRMISAGTFTGPDEDYISGTSVCELAKQYLGFNTVKKEGTSIPDNWTEEGPSVFNNNPLSLRDVDSDARLIKYLAKLGKIRKYQNKIQKHSRQGDSLNHGPAISNLLLLQGLERSKLDPLRTALVDAITLYHRKMIVKSESGFEFLTDASVQLIAAAFHRNVSGHDHKAVIQLLRAADKNQNLVMPSITAELTELDQYKVSSANEVLLRSVALDIAMLDPRVKTPSESSPKAQGV